ncbi:hypothetical protein DCAR_0312547 [Daucus carota subsp. sativus]|uniref:Uncharacterized protein n=1 Tax=Daucus carota subsp. sativus TaxID=79200 RepID=A0A166B3C7_DAUCS|nr:hypothetical protein DCAR_0312547 [Daucus carota subsp. sativus]
MTEGSLCTLSKQEAMMQALHRDGESSLSLVGPKPMELSTAPHAGSHASSGSDDGTAKLWDLRQRGAIQTFQDKYQITAVDFSDASDKIYLGGIDNNINVWDLRRNVLNKF